MVKRVFAAKVMRVVSILGVICLLALQWVWWRNAYRAVEMDFMSKADGCVGEAVEKAMLYQLDSTSKGFKVVNASLREKIPKKSKSMPSNHTANNTKEFLFVIEEGLCKLNKPLTNTLIDKQLGPILNDKFGFNLEHSIKIFRQPLDFDSIELKKYNRIGIGNSKDTIYQQIGFNAYVSVVFYSPITVFLRKGVFIMIVSILLVLLIGGILIFQFINMQRERKFSDFIIEYTRMITHELKTPVSGLQMVLTWLKDGTFKDDPKKEKKLMVSGLSQTKKIMLNLDNILYTALNEHRELKVQLNDTPINDFMERVLDPYRGRSYFPKNVVYKTHYEPEKFRCTMDMNLMEKVLNNLIDNAIKFTPEETLIEISCSKVENEVVIRVRDNGMGIPLNEQKRIFDLFDRGYTNQSSQFPGFGIGLHFVELVLKAHDGKVSVQSEVGKGTEFILTFNSKVHSSAGGKNGQGAGPRQ